MKVFEKTSNTSNICTNTQDKGTYQFVPNCRIRKEQWLACSSPVKMFCYEKRSTGIDYQVCNIFMTFIKLQVHNPTLRTLSSELARYMEKENVSMLLVIIAIIYHTYYRPVTDVSRSRYPNIDQWLQVNKYGTIYTYIFLYKRPVYGPTWFADYHRRKFIIGTNLA